MTTVLERPVLRRTVPIRVDNRSGHWDQPGHFTRAGLQRSARAGVAAVFLTEVTEVHQARVLDDVPGYEPLHDITHGDRDEVAIVLNTDLMQLRTWSTVVLGPDLGPGGRVVAGLAVCDYLPARRPVLLATWHSPASVEGDWSGRRADTWRDSLANLRDEVRERRVRIGLDAPVLVGGDWNLDFRRAWVPDVVNDIWPALDLPRLPRRGGTHAGGRYIDPVLSINVARPSMRHLRPVPLDDHRPQRFRGRVHVAARTPARTNPARLQEAA